MAYKNRTAAAVLNNETRRYTQFDNDSPGRRAGGSKTVRKAQRVFRSRFAYVVSETIRRPHEAYTAFRIPLIESALRRPCRFPRMVRLRQDENAEAHHLRRRGGSGTRRVQSTVFGKTISRRSDHIRNGRFRYKIR